MYEKWRNIFCFQIYELQYGWLIFIYPFVLVIQNQSVHTMNTSYVLFKNQHWHALSFKTKSSSGCTRTVERCNVQQCKKNYSRLRFLTCHNQYLQTRQCVIDCNMFWSRKNYVWFLSTFAKLRKATISFVTSVHLCVVCVEQFGSHWSDFDDTWYLCLFQKFVEKFQVYLKSDKNSGYFTWRRFYIYDNISLNSS
jgi:hypothetical protein